MVGMVMRKILTIYSFNNPYHYNRRLHYDFISKLCNWSEHKIVLKKDIKNIGKLYSDYKPDVIIQYAQRYFEAGHRNHLNLPNFPCLKVLILVDAHKTKKKKFDQKFAYINSYDLVVQRGVYTDKRIKCPSVWLPFSADENVFTPMEYDKKINKIGFAGTFDSYVYKQRREAISKLNANSLLVYNKNKSRITGDAYPNFLRNYIGCLTSTELNSPHAKAFEIMASGSVLLTPPFVGEKELFGENSFVKYAPDCSDIVEKAKWIIDNPDESKEIIDNAYKIFKGRHTDIIRAKELFLNIRGLLTGKSLVKRWGI